MRRHTVVHVAQYLQYPSVHVQYMMSERLKPYCLVKLPKASPHWLPRLLHQQRDPPPVAHRAWRAWPVLATGYKIPTCNQDVQNLESTIYIVSLSLSLLICVVFISPRIIYACQYVCTKLSWHRLAMVGNGWSLKDAIHRMDDQSFSRNKMEWGCQEANHPL